MDQEIKYTLKKLNLKTISF